MNTWIKKNSLPAYFVLTYAISWTIWMPIVASAQGWVSWKVPYGLYYLGSFGPMLAALIVSGMAAGIRGIRNLLSGLLKWRVSIGYYAFAILVPIGLFTIAVLLNRMVSGIWPDLSMLGSTDYLPYLGPLVVLVLWLLTYGLGEETGWRGFALPRLQKTRTAASATLVLAVLWAFWHLPAFFFRDTYIEMGVLGFSFFFINIIFATMIFTWLYNSTAGSLLIVVLFHAFFNYFSVSEAGGQFVAPFMSAPLILWALYVTRRYGVENASPLPKQTA